MQTDDVTIRRAELRDISRLETLLTEICALHCEGRPDIFRPGRKYGADALTKIIADPERPIFVAEVQGDVIGYAMCIVKKHENHPVIRDFTSLYIDDFCVDSACRGRGVGHRLFDEVKRFAADIRAHHIDLNVWAFNTGAIGFYESLGMKPERITMELILD